MISCVPHIRAAELADVRSVCRFGELHVPAHYAPLIGAEAAHDQVTRWWGEDQIRSAVLNGLVVVAVDGERIVGVGQRGRNREDHVIYKLYVHPDLRGSGLGPRLIDALVAQLPKDAAQIHVEHFAGNRRAGRFYARERFVVVRVEVSPTGEPARDVVWRVRDTAPLMTPP